MNGPDDRVRRLYANTVHSVVLYGSPVWADAAMAAKRIRDILRRVQRRVAIRCVRGYRTVSHVAAIALASQPPMELLARLYADVYMRRKELRSMGTELTARVKGITGLQARQLLMERYDEYLSTKILPSSSGRRVVGAVRPHLK
ncbi:reverse transcriptase, partial [Lasius niger]